MRSAVLGAATLASVATPLIVGILNAPAIRAQGAIDWQTRAGGKMAFEVTSVKPSKGPIALSNLPNLPLTPWDDYYSATNGLFSADDALATYIRFVY